MGEENFYRERKMGEAVNETLLAEYYSKHFPLDSMTKWLSYGSDETFRNREFSFTLAGDIYQRFLAFNTAQDFHKALVKNKPVKIDYGAVYNGSCKYRHETGFKETQRELVFDIDISDYDDVRRCCQGALVCAKCWPLMAIAVKVLKRILENDFGWSKLLFVFSGRRGIHCWVADEGARYLEREARVAVAQYCQVTVNNEAQVSGFNKQLHPMMIDSLQIIDDYWEDFIKTQELFADDKAKQRVLQEIKIDDDAKRLIEKDINETDDSEEVWQILMQYDQEINTKQKIKTKKRDKHFLQRIKMSYCYPRIDIKVTEGFNHLLKAPFSVHPKTGKICVPFRAADVDAFDLEQVPTISSIRAEHGKEQLAKAVTILEQLAAECN